VIKPIILLQRERFTGATRLKRRLNSAVSQIWTASTLNINAQHSQKFVKCMLERSYTF